MKIAYITAGAAGRYCGNCLQDNVLVLALRALGEDAYLVPTYTPIRTDIADASEQRLFFSGLRVFLEQRFEFFRRPRRLLDGVLGSRALVALLARLASKTDPRSLGELTVSMLRGEEGHQRREIDELAAWLGEHVRPDVVHISNVLLAGMARRLKELLRVPVFCGLQAEDSFLDFIPEPERGLARALIGERGREVDRLVAVSSYYADHAAETFGLPREHMSVVLPGILLDGHEPAAPRSGPELTIGYLARIAPAKGLHHLCEAFARLATEPELARVRLKVAGYLAPDQVSYASRLRSALGREGLARRTEFIGTVDRAQKLRFLSEIDVLSVPTVYPDPKGLFVLEALASGVPVVAPRHGIFPELIEETGGGVLCEPEDAGSLCDALRALLLDPALRRELGDAGRAKVLERFGAERMARETLEVYRAAVTGEAPAEPSSGGRASRRA